MTDAKARRVGVEELKPCPFCGAEWFRYEKDGVIGNAIEHWDDCPMEDAWRAETDLSQLSFSMRFPRPVHEVRTTRRRIDDRVFSVVTELSCGHSYNGYAHTAMFCPDCGAEVICKD